MRLRNLVSSLYLPIHFENQVIGVLILSSTTDNDVFDKEDISMLQGFADQAAQVINNIRCFENLKGDRSETVTSDNDSFPNEDHIRLCEEDQRYHLKKVSGKDFDILTLSDFEGNMLLGNSRDNCNYSLYHIIGKNILDFVHPDDRDSVKRVFSGSDLNNIAPGPKYRLKLLDGSYIWFESSAIVLRDKLGNPRKLLLYTKDISESKLS